MDKKLDVYQKLTIFTAVISLIIIFTGFIISTPINTNIQKSTAIQPNEVREINEQTKEYIFEFDSTQELRCLCFVSDLEQVHVYQNKKLILTFLLTTGILYCSAEHRAAVKPH